MSRCEVQYIRVLLDQFFTCSCSCTLAKILDVMIDSEMSFPEGEISSNSHVYKRKHLQLKCSVSIPEKIAIWLNRGREELVGNNDFLLFPPASKGFCCRQLGFCKQMGILYVFFFSKNKAKTLLRNILNRKEWFLDKKNEVLSNKNSFLFIMSRKKIFWPIFEKKEMENGYFLTKSMD